MSHDELCMVAGKWLKKNGVIDYAHSLDNKRQIPLVTVKNHLMYNSEHPDVIGFSTDSHYTVVIEVKVSRADFIADSHKSHRVNIGMGRLKYFCCPDGMIKPEELHQDWGLLYLRDGKIVLIKESPDSLFVSTSSERYLLGYYLRFPDKFAKNKI